MTPRPTETAGPTDTHVPPTETATPEGQSCVYGHGYWKNHPDLWPVSSLTLGDETYTDAELRDFLKGAVGGDASLILIKQLIAAKLNVANGTDDSAIATTITAADAWLANYANKLPYDVGPSSPEGQEAVTLADMLEQYNNGILSGGPPHCP
jgi:hypothetical protein